MKGRYSGVHMTVYGSILPRARSIARSSILAGSLTERAKYKLKVLDWHRKHSNVSITARHFGLGRATLHRWIKQSKQKGMLGLNEKSRRPHRTRASMISSNTVLRIIQIRKQYPAWSKYKIKAILNKEGIVLSASSIGRILKKKNMINPKISIKRRRSALRPKSRFPKGLRIAEQGDLVQMDTKYIMLTGGRKYYQFTAIDVLSKIRILRVYSSQSSKNSCLFLKECVNRFPFVVKRIQTDNGSPFQSKFDILCKELNIPHYYTYPRNPKQNTYVEISHGADEREFYQQGNTYSILSVMQEKIKEWEYIWNNYRPHEALGQLTPMEYIERLKTSKLPTKNIITLQV